MKAKATDPNAELRRQVNAGQAARSCALERLKDAAKKAAAGRPTPITNKFTRQADARDELSDSAEGLPISERVEHCREKTNRSREARSEGVRVFKETSMEVVQLVQSNLRLELENRNGNGAAPAKPA